MKKFQDGEGSVWVASVKERAGDDYKGRFCLALTPEGGGETLELKDVRWNSSKTADRTLRTMSDVELRRRLGWALGRTPAFRKSA